MRRPPRSNAVRSRPGPRPLWPAALALLLLAAAPAGAQETTARVATLAGVVLDADSGEPVAQALVRIEAAGEEAVPDVTDVTDADGRFSLEARGLNAGRIALVVERLGYETLETEVALGPGAGAVELRLEPDPVMLESLEVVLDRFEERRNSTPVAVRVLDAEQIRASMASDLLAYLESGGGLDTRPCWPEICIRRRGRWIHPKVYLDELEVQGGLDMLDGLPPSEIHLVELYAGGAMIRVYTDQFVESAARGRLDRGN